MASPHRDTRAHHSSATRGVPRRRRSAGLEELQQSLALPIVSGADASVPARETRRLRALFPDSVRRNGRGSFPTLPAALPCLPQPARGTCGSPPRSPFFQPPSPLTMPSSLIPGAPSAEAGAAPVVSMPLGSEAMPERELTFSFSGPSADITNTVRGGENGEGRRTLNSCFETQN